jgi:hypothetical protein
MNWTRSSACNTDQATGNCLEVARCHAGEIHLRSSRDPGQYIHVTNDEWAAFIEGCRQGEFDAVQ